MTANEAITNAVGLLVTPGDGQAVKTIRNQNNPEKFHQSWQQGDMDDDEETERYDLYEATMPDK